MAHPGRIVYAHPPQSDGWQYLYITFYPGSGSYSARFRPAEGDPQQVDGGPGEVVYFLERKLEVADGEARRAALKAASVLRDHASG
ncbi:MAG TPA: hypothetical protein VGM19_15115 [Armatimonadota bacterium]